MDFKEYSDNLFERFKAETFSSKVLSLEKHYHNSKFGRVILKQKVIDDHFLITIQIKNSENHYKIYHHSLSSRSTENNFQVSSRLSQDESAKGKRLNDQSKSSSIRNKRLALSALNYFKKHDFNPKLELTRKEYKNSDSPLISITQHQISNDFRVYVEVESHVYEYYLDTDIPEIENVYKNTNPEQLIPSWISIDDCKIHAETILKVFEDETFSPKKLNLIKYYKDETFGNIKLSQYPSSTHFNVDILIYGNSHHFKINQAPKLKLFVSAPFEQKRAETNCLALNNSG